MKNPDKENKTWTVYVYDLYDKEDLKRMTAKLQAITQMIREHGNNGRKKDGVVTVDVLGHQYQFNVLFNTNQGYGRIIENNK